MTFFIYSLVDVLDFAITHFTSKTHTKMDDMMAPMVRKSLRVVIVTLALVQVAQILSDKPITSILAGLGVGGLAVALAAQETIKNFFGSLVIFADKPFELGERIVVGGHDGTIEEVGFRSTRIRTLDGHLVTVPNGELANQMIQNIGKRPFIKRVMNVTITYDTPPEKVQQAIDILKELLDNHEGMEEDFPPRVFFNGFNDCSLNILAIYWYHPPAYWEFLAHAESAEHGTAQALQRRRHRIRLPDSDAVCEQPAGNRRCNVRFPKRSREKRASPCVTTLLPRRPSPARRWLGCSISCARRSLCQLPIKFADRAVSIFLIDVKRGRGKGLVFE